MADRAVSRISSNTEAAVSEDLNQYRIAQHQFDAVPQYVEALNDGLRRRARSAPGVWLDRVPGESKKMTTKWNKEAGVNWMS